MSLTHPTIPEKTPFFNTFQAKKKALGTQYHVGKGITLGVDLIGRQTNSDDHPNIQKF
jgi:hypothetical protein